MSGYRTDLYSDVFLDHGRHPRQFFAMPAPTHQAEGHNPMCGDVLKVFAKVDNAAFADLSFLGEGCILCIASCSLLTQIMKAKKTVELTAGREQLERILVDDGVAEEWKQELSPYKILVEYPTRQKCVRLAWETLADALSDQPRRSAKVP